MREGSAALGTKTEVSSPGVRPETWRDRGMLGPNSAIVSGLMGDTRKPARMAGFVVADP